MFRIDAGRTSQYCDGLSRRSFVQLGLTGLASFGLGDLLRARAEAAPHTAKDTSVILIWLDGGPSHIDLYDMKPDAPVEYRGNYMPIRTNVPGIEISELLPRQAKCADKFTIIRSLHNYTDDHPSGACWMLTGFGPDGNSSGKHPFVGSIATRETGSRKPGIPANVTIPKSVTFGVRPGYFSANFLGNSHDPFETNGDPNKPDFSVQNLQLPSGLTIDRLDDRRKLLTHFDQLRRNLDNSGSFAAIDRFQQEAYEMVATGSAAKVFDLSRESDNMRDRYGRTTWGQSALLARRLVEAGSTMVTVHCGGWDHHWDINNGLTRLVPQLDQLVSALFEDLHDRGLLDKVLVVMCGEFGRSPKLNNGGDAPPGVKPVPGRDHWGSAMFCLMGGGGVKGGRIIGSTESRGERPKDRPLTPGDIHTTLFHVLGVDRQLTLVDRTGRPVPAIPEGSVIQELF